VNNLPLWLWLPLAIIGVICGTIIIAWARGGGWRH